MTLLWFDDGPPSGFGEAAWWGRALLTTRDRDVTAEPHLTRLNLLQSYLHLHTSRFTRILPES